MRAWVKMSGAGFLVFGVRRRILRTASAFSGDAGAGFGFGGGEGWVVGVLDYMSQ